MRQLQYSPAFIFSVFFHGVVLLILIVSFNFNSAMPVVENNNNNQKIMNAVAMNLPPLPHATTLAPKPKVIAPPPRPQPALAKPLPPPVPVQKAIALKPPPKKQVVSRKLFQQDLLADFKTPQIKDHTKQQKALEKAMAKEIKEQAAQALQQQLLEEQRLAAGAKAQGEVNKYKALILQAIGQRWLIPAGTSKSMYVELLIRLAPDGTVLDVQITQGSGNASLDHSARDAVFKASPLPVPEDTDAFSQFRQFVLKMKPENVAVTG